MAKKLSACEKLQRKKEPKLVKLEHDFAGIKAGQTMFVATPLMVDAYIRKIPHGTTKSVLELRADLAAANASDGTCPVSTAIFVRMVAEASLEEIEEGKPIDQVAPFWRILAGNDKITSKLDIDPEWVDQQRALEAS